MQDSQITYNGSDIIVFAKMYGYENGQPVNIPFKRLENVMTVSLSSTVTTVPIRIGGSKQPITYMRNHRTVAGTFVFLASMKNIFIDLLEEYYKNIPNGDSLDRIQYTIESFWYDNLPLMDIMFFAANEISNKFTKMVVLFGVRFRDVGTTYSINDLYTETTMTYTAENVIMTDISSTETEILEVYDVLYGKVVDAVGKPTSTLNDYVNERDNENIYRFFKKTNRVV